MSAWWGRTWWVTLREEEKEEGGGVYLAGHSSRTSPAAALYASDDCRPCTFLCAGQRQVPWCKRSVLLLYDYISTLPVPTVQPCGLKQLLYCTYSTPPPSPSLTPTHQDVVTADPATWSFDPFSLSIEGDTLRGRGVTDCLGHVALLTELFRQLGEARPALKETVVGVFIANEENATVRGRCERMGVGRVVGGGWQE